MLDEERDCLACVTKDADHVEGSELSLCDKCGNEIWVSPSGLRLQEERDLRLVCIPCATPDLLSGAAVVPVTPGQIRELASHAWKEHVWEKGGPA